MTSVYLVTNNGFLNEGVIYKDYCDLDERRKNRPLSVDGEKFAVTIAKKKMFDEIDAIYSSPFLTMVDTAKYLANRSNVDIIVDNRLEDRVVGDLNDSKINLRYLQEHDFDYKLTSGESINDVKIRMTSILKEIINDHKDTKTAVFTHNICLQSILSIWCEMGYNFEEKMILEYNDQVIVDGLRNDFTIVRLDFENENIKNIKKLI